MKLFVPLASVRASVDARVVLSVVGTDNMARRGADSASNSPGLAATLKFPPPSPLASLRLHQETALTLATPTADYENA